jgi:hypothetical protein
LDLKDWVPVAQFVAAACAVGGLLFTAFTIGRSRRTADLQALQKFSDDTNAREAALAEAQTDSARLHAFNEFLNFLELYACAYNHRLIIGGGSKKIVRHKLIDSFIELDAAKQWHPHVGKAIDRYSTFIELRKFINSHRMEVEQRKAERNHALTAGTRDTASNIGEPQDAQGSQ